MRDGVGQASRGWETFALPQTADPPCLSLLKTCCLGVLGAQVGKWGACPKCYAAGVWRAYSFLSSSCCSQRNVYHETTTGAWLGMRGVLAWGSARIPGKMSCHPLTCRVRACPLFLNP